MATYAAIGRRLALVNAAAIAVIVALVGGITLGVLHFRIEEQTENALVARAKSASAVWVEALSTGGALPNSSTDPTVDSPTPDEADETSSDELVESGDTFVFGFDRTGALVANPRGLNVEGLPNFTAVNRALAGVSNRVNLRLVDGEHVRVYTMPIRSQGEIVGAAQVIQGNREHDQTMRLLWLAVALSAGLGIVLAAPSGMILARRAMRPIDRSFEQQRAFVADAAHELRTPLTVLRANAEMIKRIGADSADELDIELDQIIADVDDMSRLVNDLLDLARADSNRLIIATERVDFAALVEAVVASMRELAVAAGLTLAVESNGTASVEGDPARLRQLVRALVDNAISFTAPGGRVWVRVQRHDRDVVLEVQDTGIGIPPEDHANVFRRFYRTDHARGRSSGGTGLGLSIAAAIVEAHRGAIWLDSKVGAGTKVFVRIRALD